MDTATTTVRERPILFKGDMVRALLAGIKTQTRRVIDHPDGAMRCGYSPTGWGVRGKEEEGYRDEGGLPWCTCTPIACPYGHDSEEFGETERLWVRESCCLDWANEVVYKADDPTGRGARNAGYPTEPRWRPSIHMPRRACRIVLEITDIRAQRIQEITDEDIQAEGIAEYIRSKGLDPAKVNPRAAWIDLWDSINAGRDGGRYAWAWNPWTWAITFRRLTDAKGVA
jgi:hypothetical protein